MFSMIEQMSLNRFSIKCKNAIMILKHALARGYMHDKKKKKKKRAYW